MKLIIFILLMMLNLQWTYADTAAADLPLSKSKLDSPIPENLPEKHEEQIKPEEPKKEDPNHNGKKEKSVEFLSGDEVVQFQAGYAFGKFIGITKNYAELGWFVTPTMSPCWDLWQPLIDLRGYLFDDGKWGASAGTGVRYYNPFLNHIYGVNLFYDFLNGHSGNFDRLGVGFELLGRWVDFRINTYIPLRGTTHHSSEKTFRFPGGFVATCNQAEFAFYGADAEVGSYFCRNSCINLYSAIGPYYYNNRHTERIYGGFFRLELQITPYIIIQGRVSYDKVFKTHAQGECLINLPLYHLCNRCVYSLCGCNDMHSQPIRRTGIIFTKRCCDWTWNW